MYNPLDLLINDLVELTFDEEFGVYDVEQIIAYTTERDGNTVQATRYFLNDVETEEIIEPLVLEVVEPTRGAPSEQYLFTITEAFEHDEEFVDLLNDDVFIISEESEDEDSTEEIEEIEYTKISHVSSRITVVDEKNETNFGEVEVWTYQREEDGDIWYLVVEVDADDGWTTLYEGYSLAEGEWQLSRLSGNL